ncbi:peptide deformylase [Streptomyces sp. NPDC005408]|uniref:peptide deformylase n=1 Tax=Streptomyces sp. NPDC005408 TaxID=3155341 RepID=UPI0033A22408
MVKIDLPDLVEELLAGPRPLPIVAAGDPVLRRRTLPVEGQLGSEQLNRLITAMRETMHAAPGVGLAAPQVGIPLQIAVVEDPADVSPEVREVRGRVPLPFRVLINPTYEPASDQRIAFFEGCLSVPGWQAVVVRHARVRLRGLDEKGQVLDEEVAGWPARIVQHETDHLGGTLYIDRAETRSFSSAAAVAERWNQPAPDAAAQALDFRLPSRLPGQD